LLFRFGWAKPVPINPLYFKNKKQGIILTSIAGPLSNLLLAFVGAFLLKILYPFQNAFLNTFFYVFIYMNIALALFNLLPISMNVMPRFRCAQKHKRVRALTVCISGINFPSRSRKFL